MRAVQGSAAAILCAAGVSSRMGGVKKEYLPLGASSLTVLGCAFAAFAVCARIERVVIAVPPGSEEEARASLPEELAGTQGRLLFTPGGPTRRASVHNALSLLEPYKPSHVLIHDGARPWVTPCLIEKIIDAAVQFGAAIPALTLQETPKELEPGDGDYCGPVFIKRHLKRARLCAAQTPQGFRFPEILSAHEKAAKREAQEHVEYTDDAEVWGEFIGQVAVIPGDPANRKITYPGDMAHP